MNQLNSLYLAGDLRLAADKTITGDGRLHVSGAERLYVLNRSGAIVSKAWGGSGDLVVEGRIGVNGQPAAPRTRGWGGGIHTWDIEVEGTGWSRSGWQTGRRDVAENHYCEEPLEAGAVVSFCDRPFWVSRSRGAEDERVMGVVSAAPGMLLGADPRTGGSEDRPAGPPDDSAVGPDAEVCAVALAGRVPCCVTEENGPIRPGDLLTSATTPGHAMRAEPVLVEGVRLFRTGTILGKAMAASRSPVDSIQVLVCLS